MSRPQSNSSRLGIDIGTRLKYWIGLYQMRRKHPPDNFDQLFDEIEQYSQYLHKYAGITLQDAKVLEIGYGARPLRLIILMSMGVDVFGVDLDCPLLSGSPAEFLTIYRKNGIERFVKSAMRFYLFDRSERRGLAQALRNHGGHTLLIERNRFYIADAGSPEFTATIGPGSLDFIFSEDVFEHIPMTSMQPLVASMAQWMKPNGIALIRPHVFTGITGNHLLEWFPHTMNEPRERLSEPWEHLRKKRYQANTYLNELWRADYRKVFTPYFDILEEDVQFRDLGRQFLTPEVQQELRDIPDEELFSNQVLFVLRRKDTGVVTPPSS